MLQTHTVTGNPQILGIGNTAAFTFAMGLRVAIWVPTVQVLVEGGHVMDRAYIEERCKFEQETSS